MADLVQQDPTESAEKQVVDLPTVRRRWRLGVGHLKADWPTLVLPNQPFRIVGVPPQVQLVPLPTEVDAGRALGRWGSGMPASPSGTFVEFRFEMNRNLKAVRSWWTNGAAGARCGWRSG